MPTSKIKIIHIITRMDRGGAPDIVRILFEKNNNEQFDLKLFYGQTICSSEKTKELIKRLGKDVVLISSLRREINLFYDFAAFINILCLLFRERPDIVHAHTAKAGVLGRIAAKIAGVRYVIYSPHGHDFYGYFGKLGSKLVVFAERFAAFFCDKIHALTELEKKDLLDFKICPEEKISIIYSGVELDVLRNAISSVIEFKKKIVGDANARVVGMVGRLEEIKGPQYFIEAAGMILKKMPRVKFLVAGEGSLRGVLEKRVSELNICNSVIFTGWQEDVAGIFPCLDILVLPSLNEGVGRSVLEAQAVGVPVIASKVGGVPEVVIDGGTGILVEPKNSFEIAEAVLNLLEDEGRRKRMSFAAKEWVDEQFSDTAMVKGLERLYLGLVKKHACLN